MTEAWDGNLVVEGVVDGTDVRVTVMGEIDAASAPPLQRRLDEVIESTAGAVVLNMSGVSFIDSTGLSALLNVRQHLAAHNRSLTLRDVSAPTRQLLELTGLGPLLGADETT